MEIHSYQIILLGKNLKLKKNNLVPVRNKQRIGCFYNYHAETEDHNRITTFLPTTLLLLIIFTILLLHISSSPASF